MLKLEVYGRERAQKWLEFFYPHIRSLSGHGSKGITDPLKQINDINTRLLPQLRTLCEERQPWDTMDLFKNTKMITAAALKSRENFVSWLEEQLKLVRPAFDKMSRTSIVDIPLGKAHLFNNNSGEFAPLDKKRPNWQQLVIAGLLVLNALAVVVEVTTWILNFYGIPVPFLGDFLKPLLHSVNLSSGSALLEQFIGKSLISGPKLLMGGQLAFGFATALLAGKNFYKIPYLGPLFKFFATDNLIANSRSAAWLRTTLLLMGFATLAAFFFPPLLLPVVTQWLRVSYKIYNLSSSTAVHPVSSSSVSTDKSAAGMRSSAYLASFSLTELVARARVVKSSVDSREAKEIQRRLVLEKETILDEFVELATQDYGSPEGDRFYAALVTPADKGMSNRIALAIKKRGEQLLHIPSSNRWLVLQLSPISYDKVVKLRLLARTVVLYGSAPDPLWQKISEPAIHVGEDTTMMGTTAGSLEILQMSLGTGITPPSGQDLNLTKNKLLYSDIKEIAKLAHGQMALQNSTEQKTDTDCMRQIIKLCSGVPLTSMPIPVSPVAIATSFERAATFFSGMKDTETHTNIVALAKVISQQSKMASDAKAVWERIAGVVLTAGVEAKSSDTSATSPRGAGRTFKQPSAAGSPAALASSIGSIAPGLSPCVDNSPLPKTPVCSTAAGLAPTS